MAVWAPPTTLHPLPSFPLVRLSRRIYGQILNCPRPVAASDRHMQVPSGWNHPAFFQPRSPNLMKKINPAASPNPPAHLVTICPSLFHKAAPIKEACICFWKNVMIFQVNSRNFIKLWDLLKLPNCLDLIKLVYAGFNMCSVLLLYYHKQPFLFIYIGLESFLYVFHISFHLICTKSMCG